MLRIFDSIRKIKVRNSRINSDLNDLLSRVQSIHAYLNDLESISSETYNVINVDYVFRNLNTVHDLYNHIDIIKNMSDKNIVEKEYLLGQVSTIVENLEKQVSPVDNYVDIF